jgi:hypothetical protein
MTRISQIAVATITALTGLYLISSASKAETIQGTGAPAAIEHVAVPTQDQTRPWHDTYRHGYRPPYGYDYGYNYGWQRPVVGTGLGFGRVYLGL